MAALPQAPPPGLRIPSCSTPGTAAPGSPAGEETGQRGKVVSAQVTEGPIVNGQQILSLILSPLVPR